MNETVTEHPEARKDRKLGDEWMDWNGDMDADGLIIDEKRTIFLVLASAVLFLFILLLFLGWYMVKPRVGELSPTVATIMGLTLVGLTMGFLISMTVESVMLCTFKKSFFPYTWVQRFSLALLPMTIWLGAKFGISRDRVGNSFIKMHNLITKSFAGRLDASRLLILLPRCLKAEARRLVLNRVNSGNVNVRTVAGGEEARETIRHYRPTMILAIACERDLMSGLRDVAERIPVLAIPNRRPDGPCRNTDFSLAELDEALQCIRNSKLR